MAAVANVAINVDSRGASQKLREVANRSKEVEKAVNKKNKSLNKSQREFQKQGKAAGTASYNIQRFGVALRSTLAPLVAATAAIGFLNRALSITAEREADAGLLASGLRKIGAAAGDLEKFQKIASDIGEQTLFDQEDFTQGFALLTSFRGIGQDSFERVSRAAADMAATTKQDVNSSLLQMAKALENPVQGLSAMSRSGTTFTEQQKNVVKALVATNRTLEAQNFILSVVEGQYEGNALAAAQGLAAAQDTLSESFRDFNEVVGKIMLDPAIAATNLMTDAVKFLTSELTQTKEAFDILLPRLGRLFYFLTPLEGLFRNLSGTIEQFKDALVGTIPGLGGAITMLRALKQLRDGIIGSGGDDISVDLNPEQGADLDMKAIRRQAFQADLIKRFGNFKTPKTGSAGGKAVDRTQQRLDAGAAIEQQLLREMELRRATTDLDRELLQINYQLQDTLANINANADESQKLRIKNLAALNAEAERMQVVQESFSKFFRQSQEQTAAFAQAQSQFSTFFKQETQQVDILNDALKGTGQILGNTLMNVFDGLINKSTDFNEVLSQTLAQIGSMLMNAGLGMLSGQQGFGFLKFLGFGARAGGGPVSANQPYLVGERGPELFVPGASGGITNNHEMNSMMSRQRGIAPALNFSFETTNIGGTEYVSREQLEAAMAATRRQAASDGAQRGMNMTLDKMQQSPATRRRIGIS